MFKKIISMLALSAFTASTLSACGANSDSLIQVAPQVQEQTQQQVTAQSYFGIKKQVEKAIKDSFKEMNKNGDKFITPDEYGISTPDQAKAFYELDKNKDGKVSLDEMLPNFFGGIFSNLRLKKAADSLFRQIDKDHDGYVNETELTSPLVSAEFLAQFKKFDIEKKGFIFNRGTLGKLSKSEFENEFAAIASTAVKSAPPAPPATDSTDPAAAI
ncbi:MAG: EF-hand domain-containing protein [Candidatus Sericytochromatia bacterium]|nr:EF-hand domain-containing protein [Candidatus Sericytochromatia bacterium]